MDIARFYMHHRGSVICVRDGSPVHKGIIHSVQIDGCAVKVWIIDNNPRRGGVGFRTLEDFTGGNPAWLEYPIQWWPAADAIIRRAESQLGRAYELFTFNCEHFVTLALGRQPQSKQLQGYGWLALGIAAAVVVASSSPRPARGRRQRARR